MGAERRDGANIREMAPEDLEQIVAIDIKVLAKPRPEYWRTKLELVRGRERAVCLVAEREGRVVGFIIGGASSWEYGVPENAGWIDTIGVDPEQQKQGIARMLFEAMAEYLKGVGVETIHTFVKRLDWKLLKYFQGMGFVKGDMLSLERRL